VREAAAPYAVHFINARGAVFTVAFSPDGKFLATGGKGGTVRLWNPTTGLQIGQPLGGQGGQVNSVAFSPDGKMLASGGQDGKMRLWDTTARRLNKTLDCQATVLSVAFSHVGSRLACGTEAREVLWWIRPRLIANPSPSRPATAMSKVSRLAPTRRTSCPPPAATTR